MEQVDARSGLQVGVWQLLAYTIPVWFRLLQQLFKGGKLPLMLTEASLEKEVAAAGKVLITAEKRSNPPFTLAVVSI